MKVILLVLIIIFSSCAQISNLNNDYRNITAAARKEKKIVLFNTFYKIKMRHKSVRERRVKTGYAHSINRSIQALQETNIFSEVLNGIDKYDSKSRHDITMNIFIDHVDDRNLYLYLPWVIISLGTLAIIPLRSEHEIKIEVEFNIKEGNATKKITYGLSENPIYWTQLFLLPFSEKEHWDDTPAFPGNLYKKMLKKIVVMAQKDGVL